MTKIKVSDIVRVSEDAPKLYTDNGTVDWNNSESVVTSIDGDAADIKQVDDNEEWFYLAIPTKYLIKVNAEPKEPTIKVEDRVRVKQDTKMSKFASIFKRGVSIVKRIENGKATLAIDRLAHEDLELTDVPLECIEKVDAIGGCIDGISEEMANNMTRVLEDSQRNINDIANSYVVTEDAVSIAFNKWRQYEADLAKELAVQMVKANRNNYEKIGKMAVDIAKSVVENLKKRGE